MSVVKTFAKEIIGKMGFTIARNQGSVDNQSYYCKALTGMSGYNISINSDLTVSCSCSDSQNEGLLGNLKKQTLKEIFEGEKANNFRKSLADGVLPVPNICPGCPELVKVPRFVADYYTRHFGMPVNGIMIENCVSCNYKCIYCPARNVKSYRSSNIISYEDIILIGNEIKGNAIKHVSFFKLGEPFVDNEILRKLKILKEINPDVTIFTSTNGMLINTPEKIEASLLFDGISFSVDGINTEMLNKYQIGADFETVMKNIKTIAEEKRERNLVKPTLIWKYVVFSWNESPAFIEEAFCKAKEIGFNKIWFTHGGTWDAKATSHQYFEAKFILQDKYKLEKGDNRQMEFNL